MLTFSFESLKKNYSQCFDIRRCSRNNFHILKNHCGFPKAVIGVRLIPGRIYNKDFSRNYAVGGWVSIEAL